MKELWTKIQKDSFWKTGILGNLSCRGWLMSGLAFSSSPLTRVVGSSFMNFCSHDLVFQRQNVNALWNIRNCFNNRPLLQTSPGPVTSE